MADTSLKDGTYRCASEVRLECRYDDPWRTPITGALVRIEDSSGVVLPGDPGGPTTRDLAYYGLQDGDVAVPSRWAELGTFPSTPVQPGMVRASLVADPAAEERIRELEQSILLEISTFARSIESDLEPWIREWNDSGWWGVAEAFFEGILEGLTAWWEGEGDFWESVWEVIKSLPDAIVDGATALYDWSVELWNNRDKIFDLFKAFADGAVDVAETLLEALVSLPGEIGELIKDIVQNSREWTQGMIEMMDKTCVLDVLFATAGAVVFSIPPNFWAEALGRVGGFLIPEIIISIIFLVIAAFTAGGGAAALAVRLTAFASRTLATLRRAGRAGRMVGRILEFIFLIYQKLVDLVWALKRGIDEVVESATDIVTRVVRRSGRRVRTPTDIPCFNQPPNTTRQDFLDQLQEQENAINNTNISELMERRAAVQAAGGTGALRDTAAQRAARDQWLSRRQDEILSSNPSLSLLDVERMARAEASRLDATHALDIIAGGDPSAISGLQDRSVNRSLGSQWRTRVDTLDTALADQARRGGMKANIRLRPC
jgi:hypothetical protein